MPVPADPRPVSADEIIDRLGLQPHPEGGCYIETFRDVPGPDGRAASTAIYYLLRAGEVSHWHRIDAVEVWHIYAGAPLELRLSSGTGSECLTLGANILAGERPQGIVPVGTWQSARSLGDWTLVGCTVAPGFSFAGFEMAPMGWEPGRS
jgi:predicted cupin superfamily sugar epimerase